MYSLIYKNMYSHIYKYIAGVCGYYISVCVYRYRNRYRYRYRYRHRYRYRYRYSYRYVYINVQMQIDTYMYRSMNAYEYTHSYHKSNHRWVMPLSWMGHQKKQQNYELSCSINSQCSPQLAAVSTPDACLDLSPRMFVHTFSQMFDRTLPTLCTRAHACHATLYVCLEFISNVRL